MILNNGEHYNKNNNSIKVHFNIKIIWYLDVLNYVHNICSNIYFTQVHTYLKQNYPFV